MMEMNQETGNAELVIEEASAQIARVKAMIQNGELKPNSLERTELIITGTQLIHAVEEIRRLEYKAELRDDVINGLLGLVHELGGTDSDIEQLIEDYVYSEEDEDNFV